MEYNELMKQIFEICLFPLLGILTAFLIIFISKKAQEIKIKVDNDLYNKYIDMLQQTIINCVVATNQTYVNALKAEGKFDSEAQKIAFQKTYDAVMTILSDDAKTYLNEAIGDLQAYIINQIETEVNFNKEG